MDIKLVYESTMPPVFKIQIMVYDKNQDTLVEMN